MLGPNKCLVEKNHCTQENVSPKKCWVQIYVGSKIYLGLKKYWYWIFGQKDFYPTLFGATKWSLSVLESPCCVQLV